MSMATQEPAPPLPRDRGLREGDLRPRDARPRARLHDALAERLGVTPGSVSAMVKKLADIDLVTHTPYRGVRLTPAGRRTALEVIRHHRLLELFLAEVLEMPWDRVHQEAEVLEHVLSPSSRRSSPRSSATRRATRTATRSPAPTSRSRSSETRSLADLQPGDERRLRARVRLRSRRCCATSATAASRRAPSSRCSSASRSAARCSCASARDVHPLGGDLAQAMRVEMRA